MASRAYGWVRKSGDKGRGDGRRTRTTGRNTHPQQAQPADQQHQHSGPAKDDTPQRTRRTSAHESAGWGPAGPDPTGAHADNWPFTALLTPPRRLSALQSKTAHSHGSEAAQFRPAALAPPLRCPPAAVPPRSWPYGDRPPISSCSRRSAVSLAGLPLQRLPKRANLPACDSFVKTPHASQKAQSSASLSRCPALAA